MGKKADLSMTYWNLKRKNVGNHAFFRNNYATLILKKKVKIQRMYGNFFPNLSSIISEKCEVTPNFLFGF